MAIMNAFPAGGGGGAVREIVERTISRYQDKTITFVGSYAFAGCVDLSYVSLPQLSSAGNYAFAYCPSLSSVEFSNLATAGDYAFTGCTNLEAISLPMFTGGSRALDGFNSTSALRYVSLPNYGSTNLSIRSVPLTHLCLGISSLNSTILLVNPQNLVSLVLPNLTKYDPSTSQAAFSNLEYVEIGGSTINDGIPYGSKTKTISFPNASWISVYNTASSTKFFETCSSVIETIYAPNLSEFKATTGAGGWFICSSYPKLKSVNLRNASFSYSMIFYNCPNLEYVDVTNVSYIRQEMFRSCPKLKSIRLEKVSNLSTNAFLSCTALESVYILTSAVPTIASNAFNNTPIVNSTYLGRFGSIFVKQSMVNAFKTNASWSSLSARITSYTG